MAGKLKREEVKSVLETLSNVNRSLASCLQSLGETQKQLEKSVKCQSYLNHSQNFCIKFDFRLVEGLKKKVISMMRTEFEACPDWICAERKCSHRFRGRRKSLEKRREKKMF